MASIIVGFDGSTSAVEAVRWAASEGRLRGWPVTAVLAWSYLTQPHVPPSEEFVPTYGPADAEAALKAMLQRDVPEIADQVGRRVVCDLPSAALLGASADADLLVVGARGLGGFRRAVLGSVSQQVVHHSTVPVAVVRTPAAADGPVVVGIDGSETARLALAWAIDEARARQAKLIVVHAWQVPTFFLVDAVPPAPDIPAIQFDAERLVDRALKRADTSGLAEATIERVVVGDSATDAILDAAQGASVVVVGTRGHGGFAGLLLGSVSQHLVHHVSCPIVVVPPAK